MLDSSQTITSIKYRIYLSALPWGAGVALIACLLNFKNKNGNLASLIFLPSISIVCLVSILLFRRYGVKFIRIFEGVIYLAAYLFFTAFLINTAYNGAQTGLFLVQKFLIWLPIIHIISFMMFSKNTALRLALSFLLAFTLIGSVFLFLTMNSPYAAINFQTLFEIFFSNLMYVLTLYFIVILKDMVQHREMRASLIAELAYTDSLTGAFNRRKINELLLEYTHHGARFSVIMIDLDHFKKINDAFGHDQGDILLKDVTDLLRNNLRQNDDIGRWGGDEFIAICPNTTRKDSEHIQNRMNSINENPKL
ncbi:MAG TPA: diguanylate cyclase, partial [Anaerolineales bacterium]|nr:diguanylate cyclase [Anaerolineales bacterium]